MPAIVAASSRVRSFAGLPKYSCDAASTPNARLPHGHFVAVHREDFVLRVPLFDLERDERLLALRVHDRSKPIDSGKSWRESCWVMVLAARRVAAHHDVLDRREDHAVGLQPAMGHEVAIFRGHDGVTEHFGNLLEGDELAPFGRELADHGAVPGQDAGDGPGE